MEHSSAVFFIIPICSFLIYFYLYNYFTDIKSTVKDGISTVTKFGEKEKYDDESFFDNCHEVILDLSIMFIIFITDWCR